MTTIIRNTYPRTSVASEVWDLSPVEGRRASTSSIRQLRAEKAPARVIQETAEDGFEPGHERRESLFVGVVMAAALLIGSLFGGAFGGGEEPTTAEIAQLSPVVAR